MFLLSVWSATEMAVWICLNRFWICLQSENGTLPNLFILFPFKWTDFLLYNRFSRIPLIMIFNDRMTNHSDHLPSLGATRGTAHGFPGGWWHHALPAMPARNLDVVSRSYMDLHGYESRAPTRMPQVIDGYYNMVNGSYRFLPITICILYTCAVGGICFFLIIICYCVYLCRYVYMFF